MTFVPAENVAHVVVEISRGSEFVADTDLYVHRTISDWNSATQLNFLIDGVEGWWDGYIKALTTDDYVLTQIKATDLTVEAGLSVARTEAIAGTRAQDPTPGMACAVVRFTGVSGLPRRGLNFLSGMGDDDCSTDALDSTYRTDVLEAYQAFIGQVETSSGLTDLEHVILSRFAGFTIQSRPNGTRYKKPTPRTVALIKPVTDYDVRPTLGVQKRRRVRR